MPPSPFQIESEEHHPFANQVYVGLFRASFLRQVPIARPINIILFPTTMRITMIIKMVIIIVFFILRTPPTFYFLFSMNVSKIPVARNIINAIIIAIPMVTPML